MSNKLTLEDIAKAPIPEDLPKKSAEEDLYTTSEPAVHHDHKTSQALRMAEEDIRKLNLENDALKAQNELRIKCSCYILWFVALFVIATFATLVAGSYELSYTGKDGAVTFRPFLAIDSKVLITLLTTTTIQVIGLLTIVVKWLFPNQPGSSKKGKD